MQGQGGGALTWPVAVHWVCRLSSFLDGAGQGQPHLCFPWDHPTWAIKKSEMLLLVLGLGIPRQSQAVNLGWLLLVLGLGAH